MEKINHICQEQEYWIKELKFQYHIFIFLLSMFTVLFGIIGKSLHYDSDKKVSGIFCMYMLAHMSIYSEYARTNIDSNRNIRKFIKSIGIIIVPVILFMGILFIHMLGYLFVPDGYEFFTIGTFVAGWSCIVIGFICYKLIHYIMSPLLIFTQQWNPQNNMLNDY